MEYRIKPKLIRLYTGIRNCFIICLVFMIIGKPILGIVLGQEPKQYVFDIIAYVAILIFFSIRFGNAMKKIERSKVYMDEEVLIVTTQYRKEIVNTTIDLDKIIWIGPPTNSPRSKKIFVVESENKSLFLIPKQYENYHEFVKKIVNKTQNNNEIIISPNFLKLVRK
ncbi:MAG: hypothetical protein JXN65_02135 [Clostridia bacterium]|nr:hypothetical protein [Clostridia bacterium]